MKLRKLRKTSWTEQDSNARKLSPSFYSPQHWVNDCKVKPELGLQCKSILIPCFSNLRLERLKTAG